VLSEGAKRVAMDLAARLGEGLTTGVSGSAWPSYSSPVTATVMNGARQVASVSARDGALVVDAGLPLERGWHGTADLATSDGFDAVARAVAAMRGAVTYDTLEYNRRYRVCVSYKGLEKGDIVTYGGPIDNHAPHTFMSEAGKETLIDEYELRDNADRLFTPV
jgi:hypothetical protein